MIHATPPIDGALTAALADLDSLHAELAHELGRAAPWDGPLRRHARVDSVVSSVSIEGYVVDLDDARALVAGATPPSGDSDERWAVACYARAMDHVRVMSDDPAFRWLDRVVLDLHFDACLFQRDRSPGRWRVGPISVTAPPGGHVYAAPDADTIPTLVDEALAWLAGPGADTHLLVRAAMAHLHAVSIHPFRDGNGRIARILQSLVLARGGILAPEFASIEPFLATNTDDYYRQLQSAQGPAYDPSRSARAWVEFCVDGHLQQARSFATRMRDAARRWVALEALAVERGWPERIVVALEQALAGSLTRGSYLLETDVSTPTAALDLRRLVDAGLIDQTGGGRSTSYTASAALREIVTRS
ncbi:MAG: Fic family protein [Thermoleophilia bacterium]|nr:Fic family protein [Thermoleophilia bacterium]